MRHTELVDALRLLLQVEGVEEQRVPGKGVGGRWRLRGRLRRRLRGRPVEAQVEAKLDTWMKLEKEYTALRGTISTLHEKTRHKVMASAHTNTPRVQLPNINRPKSHIRVRSKKQV